MLAVAAAVLFGIAFIINASDTTTEDIFTPTSLMFVGLTLLALHLAGIGSGWSARARRR
ncbi:hypothetical protein [Streptomyces sp. B6B3]|jgi:hypothetical protein|uniref:hypothetical protein n=1 Tax=Streptomyces sp. B6B3 TaxID=3153570 RepID=UPI00325CC9AB